jgi:hypothetical protein
VRRKWVEKIVLSHDLIIIIIIIIFTYLEGVSEQGAKEYMWSEERGSDG